MRVMVFSNGPPPEGDHRVIWALNQLVQVGYLTEFKVISHTNEAQNRKIFLSRAYLEVEQFAPDILIWHRESGNDLDEELVRQIGKKTILIYHDLDPWMWFVKPVEKNCYTVARHARLVFLCGLGSIADQYHFVQDKIRYSPHGYCDIDIPNVPVDRTKRLLFIGSSVRRLKRVLGPFAPEYHPGRRKAVKTLKSMLGDRFVSFGYGYPKSWGIKPCPFDEQFSWYAKTLASFSIEAAPHAPFYASNRTPFALACGSIHIKIARRGDVAWMGSCRGLIGVKDAAEAAEAFENVCSWTDARLADTINETREFARKNLWVPDIYKNMLDQASSAA